MMRRTLPARLALIVLAGVILFATPMPVFAQSCALCYTQAASSGGRMIQALKSGILVLIVPPTVMSVAMIFILYRCRSRCREAVQAADGGLDWQEHRLTSSTTTPCLPPAP